MLAAAQSEQGAGRPGHLEFDAGGVQRVRERAQRPRPAQVSVLLRQVGRKYRRYQVGRVLSVNYQVVVGAADGRRIRS